MIEQFLIDNPDWRGDVDLLVSPPSWQETQQEFPEAGNDLQRAERHALNWNGFQVSVLAMYLHKRRQGLPHRAAEMLALQAAPRIMTDSVRFEGTGMLADQIGDLQIPVMEAACKRQGFRPNAGDFYHSQLARFPYDKEAFVPAGGGRAYIKKVCEKRGWGIEGSVSVKARQDPPKPDKVMSEQLIKENILKAVKKDPDLARKPVRELKEMVIDRHSLQSSYTK